MKEALTKALSSGGKDNAVDSSVDRILAAAFFRSRPLQAGTQAPVIRLNDRRPGGAPQRR